MDILSELTGQSLDEKYRIEKLLGQGGMGAVFLATHIGTERLVAVKVITPQFMTNPESIERFRREARAAGRLSHPNVVNVTDFGFAKVGNEQIAYLVMEYLKGCSLGALLKKKSRLPIRFVVEVVEQIAVAVQEAHNQGIIHRDLKPDNIWLEPNGRGGYNIKVLDFGLAKLRNPDGSNLAEPSVTSVPFTIVDGDLVSASLVPELRESTITAKTAEIDIAQTGITGRDDQANVQTVINNPHATNDRRQTVQTQIGAVLGTPIYMSPEQCGGEVLDARSDIYSLGIITYQMLAGEPPFTGNNMYQLILAHSTMTPPSLIEKRRDLPGSVEAIIMSALAKKAEDRPVSAPAFAAGLRANAESEKVVLNQAMDYYKKSFSKAIQLSLAIFTPFLILNMLMLLTVALVPLRSLPLPLVHLIHKGHWVFSFILILFANRVSTAAYTLFISQLRHAPHADVKIGQIISAVMKNLDKIAGTFVKTNLQVISQLLRLKPGWRSYIDHSLYGPVIAMENLRGEPLFARTQTLTSRLRSLVMRVQTRDFSLAVFTMLFSLLTFVFCGLVLDFYQPEQTSRVPILIFFTLFPAASLILFHPPIAMALSLLYFRACQIGGESLHNVSHNEFEQIDLIGASATSYRRTATVIFGSLFLVVCWVMISGTALKLAVERDYAFTIKALLAAGANISTRDDEGKTALMSAVVDGRIDSVNALLAAGANPNARTEKQWTPLMFAAENNRVEIAKMLLDAGADIEARHNYGSTALFRASRKGYNDIVKLLLSRQANVNAQNNLGLTPLMEAAGDEGNIATIKILLAAGADVNKRTRNGTTALSIARRLARREMEAVLIQAEATE